MTVSAEIVDNEADLGRLRGQWDALAVEAGQPYSAPAWMLAWWRHARPDGAALRAVAAMDGGELVGLAPLWARRDALRVARYEALAARLSPPAQMLSRPGREEEVAGAVAHALADADPPVHVLRLEDRGKASHWMTRLAGRWPGRRPWTHFGPPSPSPTVTLDGSGFDAWMQGRGSKFRHEMKRRRRRLDEAGARLYMAGREEFERTLSALIALHRQRWDNRGGSNALVSGLEEMLLEAGRELLPAGRFRLYAMEVEGRVVSAQLFVAAGPAVCGWNGGFDPEWRRFSPSIQNMLQAVRDATDRGESSIDLGPGGQRYKYDLADRESQIVVATLAPYGRAYPVARARFATQQLRADLGGRLSPAAKIRLRRLVRPEMRGRRMR